jgi:hypothetical protein
MFRATTSFVSALSGCVANDCQLNAPVFPSPSKIPYGGFSPVRLQTERCIPRPSRFRAYTRPLPMSRAPVARFRAIQRGTLTRPSRPEALGSPAGYAVPPAHRLLWPHLRLSPPPARLFASSDRLTPSHLTRGMRGSPIYSARLSLRATSHTPTPWQTAFGRFFVANSGLHHFRCGSAVVYLALRNRQGRVTRQQIFLYDAARRVARRSPAATFTTKLSPCKSPPMASVMTTRAYGQFPRPVFHRQDTQPYGLRNRVGTGV